jgi:hypothetical protein
MSQKNEQPLNPSADDANAATGRYRFQGGKPADPNAGVHPEMVDAEQTPSANTAIPNTPEALIAMQENKPEKDRPEKPEHQQSAKVKQVLELIEKLDTNAAEDQQIALNLVRKLEDVHDDVVAEMKDDAEAKHSQIISWAIDADRLYRCRMLLNSVELE